MRRLGLFYKMTKIIEKIIKLYDNKIRMKLASLAFFSYVTIDGFMERG